MGVVVAQQEKSSPLLSPNHSISVSAVNRDQIEVRLAACDQWCSCTQLQHAAHPTSSDHTCEQNINAIVSACVRGLVKAVCSIRYSSLVNRNTKDICTSDDGHTWHSQWFKHPALEHFLLISTINKYCSNLCTVCLFFLGILKCNDDFPRTIIWSEVFPEDIISEFDRTRRAIQFSPKSRVLVWLLQRCGEVSSL